jgi:uncharacterized protein (TIGR02246 family)
MKRTFFAVAVCAVMLSTTSRLKAQTMSDEQAVRKVLQDFHDALNARDLKAFDKLFAEDAEFVNVSASYAKGREEIIKMHDRAVNVVFKDVDFKALPKGPEPVTTIRFLRPDVAIVHMQVDPANCPGCAAASAAMHQPQPGKGSQQVMVWVVSKHGDRWLIDLGQNTVRIVPASPAAAPK